MGFCAGQVKPICHKILTESSLKELLLCFGVLYVMEKLVYMSIIYYYYYYYFIYNIVHTDYDYYTSSCFFFYSVHNI